jgi:hypothetical protein
MMTINMVVGDVADKVIIAILAMNSEKYVPCCAVSSASNIIHVLPIP